MLAKMPYQANKVIADFAIIAMAFDDERFFEICHAAEEVLFALSGEVAENDNVFAIAFAILRLSKTHG